MRVLGRCPLRHGEVQDSVMGIRLVPNDAFSISHVGEAKGAHVSSTVPVINITYPAFAHENDCFAQVKPERR